MRERYYVVVSLAFIALGLIIVARSVLAHAFVVGILGIVFVLLGAVRLRDYWGRRERLT